MLEPFTCPVCGAVSHHPQDGAEGYCGACHWWTGDPILGALAPDADPPDDETHAMGRRIAGMLIERDRESDGG